MGSIGTAAFVALAEGITEIRQFERDYDTWQDAVGSLLPDEDHPDHMAPPGYEQALGAHNGLLCDWEYIALGAFLDAYIEDSLLAVFTAEPRILASEHKLSYDEAVKNRDFLIPYLAQQEVARLTYESQDGIFKYFQRRLAIAVPDTMQEALSRLQAIRNCLVHNRGKLHQKYARYLPTLRVGDDLGGHVDVPDASATVVAFAEFLDARLLKKYGLPTMSRERRVRARGEARKGR